jgi:hypothetical protein
MISVEQKRAERSLKPFVLMFLEAGSCLSSDNGESVLRKSLLALLSSTRETDITGWYKANTVVGVMFTETIIDNRTAVLSAIQARVTYALRHYLSMKEFSQINMSFEWIPAEGEQRVSLPSSLNVHPNVSNRND